ncbi:MAG: amidohydrolase family protein [Planctomycetia bacterium]
MSVVIDAHQHFWRLDLPFDYGWLDAPPHAPIRRNFLPQDLHPRTEAVGVTHSVFVQTQHDLAENRWALALAEMHPSIAGIVGWVDLASPACDAQLDEFLDHPDFVGVRHVVQDEPDDDFLLRPAVLAGLATLERRRVPFDLLLYVKHLKHAATLAKRFPDLPLVIDHLAKPRVKSRSFDDWLPNFRAAAEFPNVFCKLSGLATEADWNGWTPADLKPYVQHALDLFGPSRCMFGSDWPVCNLAATYENVFHGLKEALGPIGADESAEIFGGTAVRFYRLPAENLAIVEPPTSAKDHP